MMKIYSALLLSTLLFTGASCGGRKKDAPATGGACILSCEGKPVLCVGGVMPEDCTNPAKKAELFPDQPRCVTTVAAAPGACPKI
jgi:hypothetical protein